MNNLVLGNGKTVRWKDELVSSQGIQAIVITQLTPEEKKELKRKIKNERDVVSFWFLSTKERGQLNF